MTFQALSYFLVVYEERSITTAARRLFISQQSLSAHIQKLEDDCGTPLFVRRPVFLPTYAGERLAETAREILRLQKESLTELKEIGAGQVGKMTIGFSGILAEAHLPELLRRFYEKYPKVEVSALTSDSTGLEEKAINGQIDFYIGTSASKNSEMAAIPLMDINLIVAVRESVLRSYTDLTDEQLKKALKEGLTLKKIQNVPLIFPMRGWRVREPLDRYIAFHKLNIKPILESYQSIAAASCRKGIGAGILYATTPVDDHRTDDRMLRFLLKDIGYKIHSCICYRRDHFLTACEDEFIRITKEYFDALDQSYGFQEEYPQK